MSTAHCATTRLEAGFTLVELVMVMLVIGALSVFVLPRALDLTTWRLTAFAQELQAQSMALQRMALTQRRPVVATITATGVSFDYVAGGNLATLSCPATASPCIAQTGTTTVTFNAGNTGSTATSTGSALAITVSSGSTTLNYQVETETGLFRTLP
jgi:prepilin-type N-terminal cleavage/methylation domain-containing protein